MEITSFILGVCAVIVLLMIVGTSVNYMVTKTLKRELEHTNNALQHLSRDVEEYNNAFLVNLKATRDELAAHTDSRVDKLSNALNDIIKEHEVNLNYVNEMANTNAGNVKTLVKEIGRVERGYKEKINY